MEQEIFLVSQQFVQLKNKYETSHCDQCLVMQDYFKIQYKRLHTKLQSLEKLMASNDIARGSSLIEVQKAAGIFGMYVMV